MGLQAQDTTWLHFQPLDLVAVTLVKNGETSPRACLGLPGLAARCRAPCRTLRFTRRKMSCSETYRLRLPAICYQQPARPFGHDEIADTENRNRPLSKYADVVAFVQKYGFVAA